MAINWGLKNKEQRCDRQGWAYSEGLEGMGSSQQINNRTDYPAQSKETIKKPEVNNMTIMQNMKKANHHQKRGHHDSNLTTGLKRIHNQP